MKTYISLLAALLFTASLSATVPEKISYQAVVRNTKGALVINQSVGTRISIYYYTTKTQTKNVYVETHTATTNENGLLGIEIGAGTVVEGVFANIDWGARNYFIKTEIDPAGKTNYTITSDAQLLSVPYALHAKTALNTNETDPTWKGAADTLSTIGRKGNVGIGTYSPLGALHVNGDEAGKGNVLFTGKYNIDLPGDPPASGGGTRMMWYPGKAAFRAGRVYRDEWDKDSIGALSIAMGGGTKALNAYSIALGSGTVASGFISTAIGSNSKALGTVSVALGENTIASGGCSTAMGYGTKASGGSSTSLGVVTSASGDNSTAMGVVTSASGDNSTAMGYRTIAPSYCETAIGSYNTEYTPTDDWAWRANDRLFVVGNGTGDTQRSNALTILKNGRVGIGTDTPSELLHIANTDDAARIRISSSATKNAELAFFAEDTYKGAIGYDNTNSYLYIYEHGSITFKNGAGTAKAWNTTSDGRLKTNLQTLPYGLDEVLKLKPVRYFMHDWNNDGAEINIGAGGGESMGFVAQDVYKIIPEAVQKPADENREFWSIDYQKLTPVLVKALQEQQEQIKELKKENIRLKEENSDVNARLENLEKILLKK